MRFAMTIKSVMSARVLELLNKRCCFGFYRARMYTKFTALVPCKIMNTRRNATNQ